MRDESNIEWSFSSSSPSLSSSSEIEFDNDQYMIDATNFNLSTNFLPVDFENNIPLQSDITLQEIGYIPEGTLFCETDFILSFIKEFFLIISNFNFHISSFVYR